MGLIVDAKDIGQDGTVVLSINGAEVRYVKESDLLAVKGGQAGLEGERDKLRTDLANMTTQFNNKHQELLQVRASHEEQGKQLGEFTNLQGHVTNLTAELDKAKALVTQHETNLATRVKNSLTNGYKVTADKLEGKTLADLMTMESVLSQAGTPRQPANYDATTVPGAGTDPAELEKKTPLQLATSYYESTANDKK